MAKTTNALTVIYDLITQYNKLQRDIDNIAFQVEAFMAKEDNPDWDSKITLVFFLEQTNKKAPPQNKMPTISPMPQPQVAGLQQPVFFIIPDVDGGATMVKPEREPTGIEIVRDYPLTSNFFLRICEKIKDERIAEQEQILIKLKELGVKTSTNRNQIKINTHGQKPTTQRKQKSN